MSTQSLGQACGVTPQAVSNWETIEGRGPSRDVLPRLAAALNTTVDALLAPAGDEAVNQPSDWSRDLPAPEPQAQPLLPTSAPQAVQP